MPGTEAAPHRELLTKALYLKDRVTIRRGLVHGETRWQAAMPFSVTARSSGSSVRQRSITSGHRGWKRHPGGGLRISGGDPGMPVSLRRGPVSDGKEASNPFV